MNYMLEAVAFEEWFETHSLSISAQLLWHKLMYLNYKNGWDEWVQLDNKSLMKLIEVKNEATLIRIRKELVQAELIEYQMGKKGSPSRYKIKSILEEKEETTAAVSEERSSSVASGMSTEEAAKNVTESSGAECTTFSSAGQVNLEVSGTDQTNMGEVAKNAAKAPEVRATTSSSAEQVNLEVFETSQMNTDSRFATSVEELKLFEKFWEVYPRRKAKTLAEQNYKDLILHTTGVSEEQILAAAQNYAKECRKNKTKELFIKMAHNWLKDLVWIDYLPENYKEQESKSEQEQKRERITTNRFNNIQQRMYDFNELEKALLGG